MRLTTKLREAASETSPVTLEVMRGQIEALLTESFPHSFFTVSLDHNIHSAVTIRFTRMPKAEWPNGIFHNADPMLIMISPVGHQREPEGGAAIYQAHESMVSRRGILPRMIAKKGTGAQILQYVTRYLGRVKAAIAVG